MEKKTICCVDIAKNEGFYNPHFQNCSWNKQFFSEIIKWFNAENATSLSFSQIETMFGRKLDKKNVPKNIMKENSTSPYCLRSRLFIQHKVNTWGNLLV